MEPLAFGDMLIRLAVAAAAGLVIGFERERREKAAGLRTLTLVSSGSAILVLGAVLVAPEEAVRMAAGVATGVGFLGAGAILRERGEVIGLTTAATVWVAAALGISAGFGALVLTGLGTALAILVLAVLGLVDIHRVQMEARTYEVVYSTDAWDEKAEARRLTGAGLRVVPLSVTWSPQQVVAEWRAVGRWEQHEKASMCLREGPAVVSFSVRT